MSEKLIHKTYTDYNNQSKFFKGSPSQAGDLCMALNLRQDSKQHLEGNTTLKRCPLLVTIQVPKVR